jgi:hypothetical protein
MPIKRETIIFGLPLNSGGAQSLGSYDDVEISNSENKAYVRMYINPSSFNISEKKLIQKQLTKGGYVVQYWGEELPSISIQGETGSSGIEGVNVIRSIYRHEQIQFKKILQQRFESVKDQSNNAFLTDSSDVNKDYKGIAGGLLAGVADFFTGGVFSTLTNGLETLTDVINGDFTLPTRKEYSNFKTTASLASLATSIEIYFQGEVFRGYFTNLTVNEAANTPGLFNYSMTFEVLNRSGIRKNFMPWHRSPVNKSTGEAKMASTPIEGPRSDELSVSYAGQDSGFETLIPEKGVFDIVSPGNLGSYVKSNFTESNSDNEQGTLPLKPANRRGR